MKKIVSKLINDIFAISLATFVVYFFFEYFKPGLVSNYFNLNYLLIFSLTSGIIAVLIGKDKLGVDQEESKKRSYRFIIFFSLAGGAIVLMEMFELGWFGYLMAAVSVVMIFLVSLSL